MSFTMNFKNVNIILIRCTVQYDMSLLMRETLKLKFETNWILVRMTKAFLSKSNKKAIEEVIYLGSRCGAHDWLVLKDGPGPHSSTQYA